MLDNLVNRLRHLPAAHIQWGILAVSLVCATALVSLSSWLYHREIRAEFLVTGITTAFIVGLTVAVVVSRLIGHLKRAEHEALTANRAKSRFLANMSHEIRTPINGILGMAHLLSRTPLSDAQSDQLQKITQSGQHLLAVINDILDLSKIDVGKLSLETEPFSLAEALASALNIVQLAAEAKSLALTLTVAEDVPDGLVGDPVRLTQALVNYLGNGVKFTHRGQVVLAVDCEVLEGDDCRLRFTVTDTGIGIPPHRLCKVFEAFEQGDNSTTRQFGGTGLGLAITRELAQLMGGTVGSSSQEGIGSTFWFTARFQCLPQDIPADTAPLSVEEALARDHGGKTVLIVEDEPINQQVTRFLLEHAGLTTAVANHGREALQLAETQTFDLILMDVNMPEMDGLAATRALRHTPSGRRTPIIALTANAFAEDRDQCLAAGMDDFIAKPAEALYLYARIRHWLEHPRHP